jgi:hypothetical protein
MPVAVHWGKEGGINQLEDFLLLEKPTIQRLSKEPGLIEV